MSSHLSRAAARRVLLTLTFTRWFPVGLIVGITTLWPLERGLTVAQTLSAAALVGITVFALELPTSGFADAFGRRPVYVASAVVSVMAGLVFSTASAWWQFALAAVLTGVFRALDSGPLEAWFVDTVHVRDPGADVDADLSAQGMLLGIAMAVGALVSGVLFWWHPLTSRSAFLLPGIAYIALSVVHLVAVLVLLTEPRAGVDTASARRALASVRETPVVIRDGLGLLRHNRVLAGLMAVELFWSAAMVVFETFTPIRLSELLGNQVRAGALMGPVAAAGWGVFALGAALSGMLSGRLGVVPTAVLARVLNGLGALVMGVVAGPVALVAAYLVTYSLHGSAGPMHSALLHQEATARNRSTVLSMNSMIGFLSFSVTATMGGLLAGRTSTGVAMSVIGGISMLGALFYLPAWGQERASRASCAPAAG
ncbi:MFS transporter [Lapillicoccus sp.]|uniref:MFS transporter n=1 Tax=Lapillicoccus sp. TaxID=1909287 RepID=UPI003983D3CB